jgi:molybdopterin converting factor small subunit
VIEVQVFFDISFREITRAREIVVQLDDGVTLNQLLKWLGRRFGEAVLGQEKEYCWRHGSDHVFISIDGKVVPKELWDKTPLRDGCRVSLFPPLAGG